MVTSFPQIYLISILKKLQLSFTETGSQTNVDSNVHTNVISMRIFLPELHLEYICLPACLIVKMGIPKNSNGTP